MTAVDSYREPDSGPICGARHPKLRYMCDLEAGHSQFELGGQMFDHFTSVHQRAWQLTTPKLQPDCVFCDRSKLPHTVHEFGGVMVFEPLNPVTPGHLLVVPIEHVQDARSKPELTAEVFGVAARVLQSVEQANLITSMGPAATQTVFHLHVHIVPRRHGDGLKLPWS